MSYSDCEECGRDPEHDSGCGACCNLPRKTSSYCDECHEFIDCNIRLEKGVCSCEKYCEQCMDCDNKDEVEDR